MEIPNMTNQKLEQEINIQKKDNNTNNHIYVDLDCFMSNINTLKNHTDNMMIDLSLLLSNIKSCSYVKKKNNNNNNNNDNLKMNIDNLFNSSSIIEAIQSKITLPTPKPEIVQFNADNYLVEPFTSNNQSNEWVFTDTIKFVIIVIILLIVIFRK